MKKTYIAPAMLAIATLVGACGSMPQSTSMLDEARFAYVEAQRNPNVAVYAQPELNQAGIALGEANEAARHFNSNDKVDKLAYIAKQKIALTQEVAKRKSAEAEIANAGAERNRIRLDQRTNEANQARVSAEQSKLDAQIARSETADAQARTAQLEAQLADLSAKKTERGIVITLGDVLFGTDLARLNSDGMRTAQKLANVLQQNPQRTVLIEGYADSTGSASHNQLLSERRATAVRNALQELGVASDRITSRGYGESYPVAANDSAQNRQLNRRVEIVFSNPGGKVLVR